MERNYIEEKNISTMPSAIPYEILEKLVFYMKTNLCKIQMSEEGQGTGFFCTIPYNWEETIRVLITNNHVLKENDILPKVI